MIYAILVYNEQYLELQGIIIMNFLPNTTGEKYYNQIFLTGGLHSAEIHGKIL